MRIFNFLVSKALDKLNVSLLLLISHRYTITRQSVYVWRNIEASSRNHCCCGRTIMFYIFWTFICSLSYPAFNAQAPYCHLWPVWLYHIFPHYLINGTIFGEKLSNIKCVFWFSIKLSSEIRLILRRIKQDIIINVHNSLTNEIPTWCHLLFYFTYYALNMFRTLVYPSSGACDCVDELPHRSSCSQFVVCWSFCCGWYLVVFVLQAEACK